jgi:hypothetical protein
MTMATLLGSRVKAKNASLRRKIRSSCAFDHRAHLPGYALLRKTKNGDPRQVALTRN